MSEHMISARSVDHRLRRAAPVPMSPRCALAVIAVATIAESLVGPVPAPGVG